MHIQYLHCLTALLWLPLLATAAPAPLSVSISGTPVVAFDCKTVAVSLPDILIQETASSTLQPNITYALGSKYSSFLALNTSQASLKAFRLDTGEDVSGSILGSRTLQADPNPSDSNIPDITFQINQASTATTGPVQLRLHGISATINTDVSNLQLRFGRSNSANGIQQLTQITADPSAGVPQVDLTVAQRVVATNPAITTANGCYPYPSTDIAIGPITARTLTLPAYPLIGADQGKAYYPFVAAIHQNKIFAFDEQHNWNAISTCRDFPAALPLQTGSSAIPPIPLLTTATDLSALAGLQVVQGYGRIADPTAPNAAAACEEMVLNSRYNVIYTNR